MEGGRYIVAITLDRGDGTVAVYREAAVILPGLATVAGFAPIAEEFLDPEARALLTLTLTFGVTANNTSHTGIEEAGGGGAFITQRLSAPVGTALVYFTLKKTSAQTVTVGGADTAKVNAATATADGSDPSATLTVFAVDTSDLTVGDRVFTLTLAEQYKESVVITVTVNIGHIQDLYFASLPDKRVYIQGENFDPSGIVLAGTYADGSPLVEPDLSGYGIVGFDSSNPGEKTIYAIVRGVTAALKSGGSPEGVSITVEPPSFREIYFDYGLRRSADDTQPDKYTVPLGRTLALAPVKWHIPDDAVYEWKVEGATQASASEYFRFTPSAQGSYAVTVTAKIGGQPVSTASTTVQCVDPEGTHKRSGGTNKQAAVYNQTYSPGQFTPGGGRELTGLSWSLGAWGGYIIFNFDHSVTGGVRIAGNAFATWNEPGTVWVMQDEDGDGLPNNTWYELKGSHTLLSTAKRRYAVTYTKRATGGSVWTDNLGRMGTVGNYPTGSPSPMTFVGTGLSGSYIADGWRGYVDVNDNPEFSISNAIQADGSSIYLSYIDFVKVQTALNVDAGIFGEISTEIYGLPEDSSGGPSDPAMLITGTDLGGGQYSYQFVNNSGYNLEVTLYPDPEFTLNAGTAVTKTLASSQAYYSYYGGSVNATKTTGKVTFVDGPGGTL